MIDEKDYIKLKLPIPDIYSGLATKKHMYICSNSNSNDFDAVKCQTYKPLNRFQQNINKIVIYPNKSNPFKVNTLVDCEKVFKFIECHEECEKYRLFYKANPILMNDIKEMLASHNYQTKIVTKDNIQEVN